MSSKANPSRVSVSAIALIAGCAPSLATPCAEPSSPLTKPRTEQSAPPAVEPVAATPPPAQPVPAPAEKRVAWPKLAPDENTGVIDPQPLNAALQKACGSWTFDDLILELTGRGPDRMKVQIEVYAQGKLAIGGAAADEARVFVERNDLLDLSVRGERHYVTLKLHTADTSPHQCAGWFVDQARIEWRCVKGKDQGRWVRHWCP